MPIADLFLNHPVTCFLCSCVWDPWFRCSGSYWHGFYCPICWKYKSPLWNKSWFDVRSLGQFGSILYMLGLLSDWDHSSRMIEVVLKGQSLPWTPVVSWLGSYDCKLSTLNFPMVLHGGSSEIYMFIFRWTEVGSKCHLSAYIVRGLLDCKLGQVNNMTIRIKVIKNVEL